MRQWKCPHCGEWVDMSYSAHCHLVDKTPSFAEMHAARLRGETPIYSSEVHRTLWRPEFERRDKPSE